MATNHDATPSRRGLLTLAATTAAARAGTAAATGAPAASPEIAAAVADYWAGVAEANAPGIEDELLDDKCDEIEDAAARIAAAPCRGVADLAAKVVFFVAVMNHLQVWNNITAAEGDVLVSVEAGALALALAEGRS